MLLVKECIHHMHCLRFCLALGNGSSFGVEELNLVNKQELGMCAITDFLEVFHHFRPPDSFLVYY